MSKYSTCVLFFCGIVLYVDMSLHIIPSTCLVQGPNDGLTNPKHAANASERECKVCYDWTDLSSSIKIKLYMNKQLNSTNTHLDKHVLRSAKESSGAFLSSTDPENNKIIYRFMFHPLKLQSQQPVLQEPQKKKKKLIFGESSVCKLCHQIGNINSSFINLPKGVTLCADKTSHGYPETCAHIE